MAENQQNNTQTESLNQPCCGSCDKKSCWKWIFLVAILFLTASLTYAGYQFSKLSQKEAVVYQPTPIPLPAEASAKAGDPTANWKTYTDDIYGFQINIPSSWYVIQTGGSKDKKMYPFDSLSASNYDINNPANYDYTKMKISDNVVNPLKIEIWTTSDNKKTLDEVKQEWLKNNGVQGGESLLTNIVKNEEIILNNVKAVKFSYASKLVETIIIVNDVHRPFKINLYEFRDHLESNKKLFDQILSTFKFLE